MTSLLEIRVSVEMLAAGGKYKTVPKPLTEELEFTLEGIKGDRHAGFTKPADGRDRGVRRGTKIRNWRQWSAVCPHELAMIAQRLGVPKIEPIMLGANLVFAGIDNLTAIAKGSTIWFKSGLILTIEGENAPCVRAGEEIAEHFPAVRPSEFPKLANGLRGLVGTVYAPGVVRVGDEAIIRIYEPPRALTKPPTDEEFRAR